MPRQLYNPPNGHGNPRLLGALLTRLVVILLEKFAQVQLRS
jgi:hypothetical protein